MQVDTIVALATASGPAAVALVRLSGPGALDVLGAVAPGLGRLPEPRRSVLAGVVSPSTGRTVDRVLVTVFPGPGSYTGEDVVEISGHGGWLAPALVLEACVEAGARRAEPGEFTRRAYLNGKLDLIQAEAVLDLVQGRSAALHEAALLQLDRGLSARLAGLRERLLGLEVLLAHHLDFPDEDEPPVPLGRVLGEAEEVCRGLEALLATAPEGELLREGALVVLAGRPNAGKSSLFNALVGVERAIVTELPGTTRDALEAVVSVGGFPFRLVDTAGLREDGDPVERMGIEVARRYIDRADLVLLCVDSEEPGAEELRFLAELAPRPVVVVYTKLDLRGRGAEVGSAGEGSAAPLPSGRAGALSVSAYSGAGMPALLALLPSLVYSGLVRERGEAPVLTRARQSAGVRSALVEVKALCEALEGGVPADLAATHLRPAETALEELIGVISTDDVLDRLFRQFCIGK